MSALPVVRRPRDTWDWVTLEEVERIAFMAFFEACRRQAPPAGEPFVLACDQDGRVSPPWASREDFREELVNQFAQRVHLLGLERGVTGWPATSPRLLPDGVSWQESEAMAHGCAALAVGAGAPPAHSAEPDMTANDDRAVALVGVHA